MADINWPVKQYYSQVDSQVPSQAARSCRASTNAMAIKYLLPQALLGSNADDDYLRTVLKYGDTTLPAPHRQAAAEYGVNLVDRTDGTVTALMKALERGPVGVGFLHHGPVSAPRGGGHWVLLIGATETHGIFHDPWGELDVVNGGYTQIGKGGKSVRYSWKNWLPRWASSSIGPGFYTTYEAVKRPAAVPLLPLSKATLAHIWDCKPSQIQDLEIAEMNRGLVTFDINTRPRLRHFLAQVSHESGGGRWLEELASGAAYEGRADLGNTQKGDGVKFKGAGYLQLTGRFNYTKFAAAVGDSKILELGAPYVAQNYPFTSAGFFWRDLKGLNQVVDRGASVEQVTRAVNGGLNGLADRERYYRRTLDVI